MRRQPNIFDALEGLSDEEKQKIVYGTKADQREGLIAGIAFGLFIALLMGGAFSIWF